MQASEARRQDSTIRHFAISCLIALAAYFLCLQYLFPRYFAPTAPFHPDLFIGQGFRARPHFWIDAFRLPRPAGFLAIRAIAEFGLAGSLVAVISISLLNVALVTRLVGRIMARPVPLLLVTVYALLLFAQPQFYFNHRHDTLAVLSCGYLLLSWNAWYEFRETGVRWYLSGWLICAVLLCFTKETYLLAGLLFCTVQVVITVRSPGRLTRWAVALTVLFGFLVLLAMVHNRHANSPFVNIKSDPASPYYMSLAPASLWRGLAYYLARLWTWPSAVLVLLSIAFAKNRLWAVVLLVAGTSALLTHAVLPNHLDIEYAWAGAILSFAPVLFLQRNRIFDIAAVALVAATIWLYRPSYEAQRWTVEQELLNRNTLASFDRLHQASGRVLVSGLQSPFQPFLVGDYIAEEFGGKTQWIVIVPRDTPPKRELPVQTVHASEVSPREFDHVFGYDEQGRLVIDLDHGHLQSVSHDTWRIPELQPYVEQLQKDPHNFYALLKTGAAYWDWGITDQAKEFLTRAQQASDGKNGYPTYFLGQIAESEKDLPSARRYYEQAIAADQPTPNPAFVEARRRL